MSAAIRDAGEARSRIEITGSGSSPLTVFADDPRPIQTISTLRMNKLLEHAVGDMTVIVQAGMTLEALQKHLAWRNQWLPVDPPIVAATVGMGASPRLPASRTIGGLIASNALGPLRFGCGDWRLFIMGTRWVDAAGTLVKGGGRTVKNVAGYSTPRMLIGSCGSLGAIAEVTLRTFARPEDEQCALFYCPDAAAAEALLAALFLAPVSPAWVEAITGRTFAGNPLQLPAPARGIVVAAGFLGRPEVCEAQVATLRALPAAAGMESIAQGAVASGRLRQWMAAEPAPPDGGVGFRIHAKSSAAAMWVDLLEGAGATWVVSEAGNGVIRGSLPTAAIAPITRLAAEKNARLLWTQGRGKPRISDDALYRRLKQGIDPSMVFGKCPA